MLSGFHRQCGRREDPIEQDSARQKDKAKKVTSEDEVAKAGGLDDSSAIKKISSTGASGEAAPAGVANNNSSSGSSSLPTNKTGQGLSYFNRFIEEMERKYSAQHVNDVGDDSDEGDDFVVEDGVDCENSSDSEGEVLMRLKSPIKYLRLSVPLEKTGSRKEGCELVTSMMMQTSSSMTAMCMTRLGCS